MSSSTIVREFQQRGISVNVEFSQDEGQLGGVGWKWGGGCVQWSLKSLHKSRTMNMARTIKHPVGPALHRWAPAFQQCLPPWHAIAVYFNSCLWLNIDHNASVHDVSWNENSAVTAEKFYDHALQRNWSYRFASLEDGWLAAARDLVSGAQREAFHETLGDCAQPPTVLLPLENKI